MNHFENRPQLITSSRPQTAAIYAYCASTVHSSESIAGQLERCRAYAIQKGLEVSNVHIYTESGTSSVSRKSLQSLCKVALTTPLLFSYLLLADMARYSRNPAKVLQFVEQMESLGITVCFVDQNLESSSVKFKQWLDISVLLDEQHAKSLSRKIRAGLRARSIPLSFGDGTSGSVVSATPTINLRPARHRGPFPPNEEEEAVIRRIFSLYGGGQTINEICTTLNSERVLPPRTNLSGGRGDSWDQNAIKRIFREIGRLTINQQKT